MMSTKCYVVIGCEKTDDYKSVSEFIKYTQPFGSVTELCKFLNNMYDFPEKDSRKLICMAFAQNTKLWIQVNKHCSVRISQHKIDAEVRLHSQQII